jgi:hypothetical protein
MSLPDGTEYWWDIKSANLNKNTKKKYYEVCDICGKTDGDLVFHKAIKHDMVILGTFPLRKCPICGKLKKGLDLHYKALHKGMEPPVPKYYKIEV